jgi:hypothetical protein
MNETAKAKCWYSGAVGPGRNGMKKGDSFEMKCPVCHKKVRVVIVATQGHQSAGRVEDHEEVT